MHSYFQMNGIDCIKKSVEAKEHSTIGKLHCAKDGDISYWHEREYKLIDYRKPNVSRFKDLIHICEDKGLNQIGWSKDPKGFDKLTFSKLENLTKSSPAYKPIRNNPL